MSFVLYLIIGLAFLAFGAAWAICMVSWFRAATAEDGGWRSENGRQHRRRFWKALLWMWPTFAVLFAAMLLADRLGWPSLP